jgi:hypothetical protein
MKAEIIDADIKMDLYRKVQFSSKGDRLHGIDKQYYKTKYSS